MIYLSNNLRILLPTLLHCTGLQRHRLPQLTNGRAPFVWNPSLMTYNVALKMLLLGFKIFHSVFLVPFIEEIQVRNLGFRFMTLWLCGRSSGMLQVEQIVILSHKSD